MRAPLPIWSTDSIVASVEIARPPERVFQALSLARNRRLVGQSRRVRHAGMERRRSRRRAVARVGHRAGAPYTLEGEFLEVDPPRKLVQTWQMKGTPGTPSTVTYLLETIPAARG